MKRYGSVVRVKLEALEEYKRIHKEVWPEVLQTIYQCNIRNYSIFYREGYLFSYYEYVGKNHEEDMKKMAKCPKTQQWWEITDPMQYPIDSVEQGQWWAPFEEVFHVN